MNKFIKFLSFLLILFTGIFSHASTIQIKGDWYKQNDINKTLIKTEFSKFDTNIFYISKFTIPYSGNYVIDFKNTKNIAQFSHKLYNEQNVLISSDKGGINSKEETLYFLMHGKNYSLEPGKYKLITEFNTPYFHNAPIPFVMELSKYLKAIELPNTIVLISIGILLSLIIYYFFISIARRSLLEGMYTIFIIGILIQTTTMQLVLNRITNISHIHWIPASLFVSCIAYIVFVMTLLNIEKNNSPKLYKAGITTLALIALFIVISLIIPNFALELVRDSLALIMLYGLISAIVKSLEGNTTAKFYAIAVLAFASIGGLSIFIPEISSNTFHTDHISLISVVLEALLLALVLAYRIKVLEEEKREKERLLIIQSRYENIGEITGNIAHQWRTPLGRLGSIFTSLLAKSKYSSLEKKELEESLEKSNEIIQHLSNTINTFQNFFTKSSNNKIHLNYLLTNLFEFIKESKEYENIKIKIEIKEDIEIISNENELSQIILSIIVNAKDALIKNNIKNPNIFIKAYKENSKVFIYIEDNAGGINIEPKEDIFKAHTTNKNNGTGLGLYISKTLADKNNIKISVQNNKNGAVFLLSFN